MKKLMGILLAASMVFSLTACGSTANTAASSARRHHGHCRGQ